MHRFSGLVFLPGLKIEIYQESAKIGRLASQKAEMT